MSARLAGRDAFHRVPKFVKKVWDGVETVPTKRTIGISLAVWVAFCLSAASVPVNSSGDAQATGYPDIEIPSNPPCYLELESYSATTANTIQRSFYCSPSGHPKVTHDALHLLLAYELEKSDRGGKPYSSPSIGSSSRLKTSKWI
jgi:hypothetical protein